MTETLSFPKKILQNMWPLLCGLGKPWQSNAMAFLAHTTLALYICYTVLGKTRLWKNAILWLWTKASDDHDNE